MTEAPDGLRVLVLEPFFGGSHRQFLEQWASRSRHRFEILDLPGHHWKWRMRQAPIVFARGVAERVGEGAAWDVLFCSDMLDLAQLRGLAPEPVRRLPTVAYFHENQLTYPVRFEDERDVHFGLSNLTTSLAADEVWFNSAFHRDDFLAAVPGFLAQMPDRLPADVPGEIASRSTVEWPGVEGRRLEGAIDPAAPPHLVWVGRWEHDKDPESFFEALRRLQQEGREFRVSVLGERFRDAPAVFERARHELGARVADWGYLSSRDRYLDVLCGADVVVSTARHEFFGVAVVEAALCGCWPLLPDRLSYPELLGELVGERRDEHLYDGNVDELTGCLRRLIERRREGPFDRQGIRRVFERFDWSQRAPALDDALESVASRGRVAASTAARS